MIVPKFSGGRFDPEGGKRKRIEDIQKFQSLENHLKRPAFLTLTIDRKNFEGPESAYEYASSLVSKLLTERLGLRTWARVTEVQTKSGDGWLHWHVVIDLAEWRGSMGTLRKRIWSVWRDEWKIGGCDVKLCRKSVAGYVAGYVTKAWPAIPEWMGRSRKRFRLVGFSKRANELLHGPRSQSLTPPVQKPRHRPYQRTRTLFERLASSGMDTVLILKEPDGTARLVGRLPVPESFIMDLAGVTPGVTVGLEFIVRGGRFIERTPLELPRVRSFEQAKRFYRRLMAAIDRRDLAERADMLYADRLDAVSDSWRSMRRSPEQFA